MSDPNSLDGPEQDPSVRARRLRLSAGPGVAEAPDVAVALEGEPAA